MWCVDVELASDSCDAAGRSDEKEEVRMIMEGDYDDVFVRYGEAAGLLEMVIEEVENGLVRHYLIHDHTFVLRLAFVMWPHPLALVWL